MFLFFLLVRRLLNGVRLQCCSCCQFSSKTVIPESNALYAEKPVIVKKSRAD